jgi:hypothetical protein
MRRHGLPAALGEPDEVAAYTIEAIRTDSFWAHPDVADDERLTGGRHHETVEWENEIYRTRADALITRSAPDAYLWGPPSDLLGTRMG